MDDVDFMMGEDSIMPSTEVNGNVNHVHTTVDPSKIALHGSSLEVPFHYSEPRSPGNMAKKTVFAAPLASESSSPTDSDAMDVESPPPRPVPVSDNVQVRIPPPPKFLPLPYSSSKTGLVYDSRMRFHVEPITSMLRSDDIHPEDPRRIQEIFNEIQQAGLVQGAEDSDDSASNEQCWRIQTRVATKGEICLIHAPAHYEAMRDLQFKSEAELNEMASAQDSIYFHNSTFECATLAAGGAIEACRAVVRGDVRNAIAIIRPPGHHAECEAPSGFCIFNNVPIAARVCQNDFPEQCRRVLILDWDVHHGNGIQHAFYDDPNVLYISLHVFKGGSFYPSLPDGDYMYCGDAPGVGRNVNIPWPDHGMGDAEYIYAFQEVVMPVATEFDPDLVIISAGFDAAEGDALGGCHVSPAGYAHMTHMLMRLAKGKVAVCLEGGYNLRSIARSALAVTRTLMLEPPDRLAEDLGPPNAGCVQVVEQIKREQSKYWKCMYPKHVSRADPSFFATQRLHDVIREWQSKVLADEHLMTPLTIKRQLITQSFEHNVIATRDVLGRHPLLVIFHDPPAFSSISDPVTGKTDLHNTWLTDVSKSYIDWAIRNGFEIIDANIPKVVTIEDDDGEYIRADDPEVRASQTRELASYLWENYIEPYDASQVYLMGIGGAAFYGLVDMLSNNENCTDPYTGIKHIIGFVADSGIRSIKRATDDNIGHWYYEHSLIFVANSHDVWNPNRQKKHRRKWGKLKRSEHESIHEMLIENQEEVQELLLQYKSEYEEEDERTSNVTDDVLDRGLKSPVIGSRRIEMSVDLSQNVPTSARSPTKLPPVGLFTVSSHSPRSPKSPMKRTF
ncbi:hypothetical protein P154DRAFT_579163 [Amniculicola lignicola CBS 123094]|uniref:Histone deacetylase n=1 Tax=Amniculicola lignicola CBS 123094 TaxID=1392246 RepID=A0A6A5W5U6_9PLEO|nr:hypothetical protein P154DRAFT_579163 [Amniculicola lignicola CBS 123094]